MQKTIIPQAESKSADLIAQNLEQLKQIFPEVIKEGRFRLPSRDQEQGSVKMNWLDLVMMVEGVMDDPATRLKRLKRVNI